MLKFRGLRLCGWSLIAIAVLPASVALAQVTGAIEGRTSDATGAAIAGAAVRVTNEATGVGHASVSSAEGYFRVPDLLPGTYTIRVEQPGFKTFEQSSIELRVSDRIEVNAAMQVGQVNEKMTVTSEVALVETSSVPLREPEQSKNL
jgi:hypothetical protein